MSSDVDAWGRSERTRQMVRRLTSPIYRRWFRAEIDGVEHIPVAGGATIRESPRELPLGELAMGFDAVQRIGRLDPQEHTILVEPHFGAAAFKQCEDAEWHEHFWRKQNGANTWLGWASSVPVLGEHEIADSKAFLDDVLSPR